MTSGIRLLLRCPRCKNKMLYSPAGKPNVSRRKRCVYCGHSFQVGKNIVKRPD